MAHDPFFEVPRTRLKTSLGDVELPGLYRDASAVVAFFRVDPGRAAEALAGTLLAPARFVRATAIAALAAYDYRDSSVGPYREVALALAVVPRHVAAPVLSVLHLFRETAHRDVGWHVLHMPVTTEIAEVAGRELYGFPKFVTGIAVEPAPDALRVVVQAPSGEEPILTLEGKLGPALALGAMDLVLYTVRSGELLRTVVEARGRMQTGFGRGLTLRTGGASHPMVERLKALGLDEARAFAAQACGAFRSVLHVPAAFEAAVAKAA